MTEATFPTFGDWLRELLKRANLSITKLANMIGVDRTTVHRWLSNDSYPVPLILRLLRVLGRDFQMPPPPARPERAKPAPRPPVDETHPV